MRVEHESLSSMSVAATSVRAQSTCMQRASVTLEELLVTSVGDQKKLKGWQRIFLGLTILRMFAHP